MKKIIGGAKKFKDAYKTAIAVANSDANVLLLGESGTGKEIFAKIIHEESNRKDFPFVAINCSNLTNELLQSELFGHAKGAFTGAIHDKKGKIRLANKGTIFLDEIGELDISVQPKLLRVLQERVVEPLGSDEGSFSVDIRIIAATNRNLKERAEKKLFRQDLYYRLNVVNITLPPLRDRIDDIHALAEYFIKRAAAKLKLKAKPIDKYVIDIFKKYCWPGNIRELENLIERAMILSNDRITIHDIPQELKSNGLTEVALKKIDKRLWFELGRSWRITVEEYKSFFIEFELRRNGGNISRAADSLKGLNITRQNIRTHIRRFGSKSERETLEDENWLN